MKIVRSIAELREARNGRIGFVPTMGAFHDGHLDLMRRGREECDQVIVSVFVNPTQFGPKEDLSRYPRDLDRDATMAESVGVDLLFVPDAEEMVGPPTVWIEVPEVARRWEGEFRPTHFRGVATIVGKLFNTVGPCRAYFGWKDLQQCLVIRDLVAGLSFEVELTFCETTRDEDGLALSSRNVYLTEDDRATAKYLRQTLLTAATRTLRGELVDALLKSSIAELASYGFKVDYFAFADIETLAPLKDASQPGAFIAAARLGSTRLIDNVRLDEPTLQAILAIL